MSRSDLTSYKYLDRADRSYVRGMHECLDTVHTYGKSEGGKAELKEVLETYFTDLMRESDDPNRADIIRAFDKVGMDVAEVVLDFLSDKVSGSITEVICGFIDSTDDVEERACLIDSEYESLELTPDMTLLDDEGYEFGVIKSVGEDNSCVVVLSNTEDEGGRRAEVIMYEDDVKDYTIIPRHPICTIYRDGKKILHYQYSGDIESPVEDKE